jgi:glycosyltransferase involved in cell wall biosynthesis
MDEINMINNQLPKVSIVTITYNAEKHIEKTIKSVLEQNYSNIEYIIIDGNSTDSTLEIINKYKKNIDIVISEPDNGIYDAMNKGLSNMTGSWVNFLNAGDTFYDSMTLNNIFKKLSKDIKLIYGDWISINDKDLNLYMHANPVMNLKELSSKFLVNHQSLFVQSENLPKYDTNYRIKGDYQWVIDIVKRLNYNNIQYINKPLVFYDIEGLSANDLLANVREYIYLTYRNFGNMQVLINSPIYLKYLIKHVLGKTNIYPNYFSRLIKGR